MSNHEIGEFVDNKTVSCISLQEDEMRSVQGAINRAIRGFIRENGMAADIGFGRQGNSKVFTVGFMLRRFGMGGCNGQRSLSIGRKELVTEVKVDGIHGFDGESFSVSGTRIAVRLALGDNLVFAPDQEIDQRIRAVNGAEAIKRAFSVGYLDVIAESIVRECKNIVDLNMSG